ncbi:MAG TPA: hypothetical protein DF383_05985 [Deltaproteobacteria bacterium]|nr:hypothetical protein [Deltaproteobacteria bacterium]
MTPSPLPKPEQMTDILDLKDIAAWDLRWVWALLASFAFLMMILALRRWWKKSRRNNKEIAVPLTPLEAALKKLDELVNSRLAESGQVRRFYFGLSDLFREFIERELKIPACEATLEELRPKLHSCRDLDSRQIQQAAGLLELADMAKFAKLIPPPGEIAQSVQECRSWMTELAEARERAEAERLQAAKAGA